MVGNFSTCLKVFETADVVKESVARQGLECLGILSKFFRLPLFDHQPGNIYSWLGHLSSRTVTIVATLVES